MQVSHGEEGASHTEGFWGFTRAWMSGAERGLECLRGEVNSLFLHWSSALSRHFIRDVREHSGSRDRSLSCGVLSGGSWDVDALKDDWNIRLH
jgi:hypothetical protein